MAFADEDGAVMRVPRLDVIAMVDQDSVSVAAVPSGGNDGAGGGR